MDNEALVLQVKTGDNPKEAMQQLFLQNQRFIYGIAKRYTAYAEIDDLMQESECISLSDFVAGTDDFTIEECLADPVDMESEITETIAKQQLSAQLWKIVDELDGKQGEVISERYHYSKTLEEVGKRMNLTSERVRQIEAKALEILHQKESLKAVAENYGYCGYLEGSKAYHGSFQNFKNHRSSIVEFLALRNIERSEREQSEWESIDKLFDDIMSLATN